MLRQDKQAFWDQVRGGLWAWQAGEVVGVSGKHAQRYFAQETHEYPLIADVPAAGDLPPLDSLDPPPIDPSDLSELDSTLRLLRETGAIP